MISKSLISSIAAIAVICFCVEANAQSGSRNAAPSFSAAPAQSFSTAPTNVQPTPSTTFAAPGNYQPAASPLGTIGVPTSPRNFSSAPTVAPQPFTSSSCPNCQMNATTQAPVVMAPPTYYPPAPSYAAAPVYSAPVYRPTQVYSAPRYLSPSYSLSAPVYRPVIRSYPRRVYGGGCGGY